MFKLPASRAIVIALITPQLLLASCAARDACDGQSLFLSRRASDEDLRAAYARTREAPTEAEGRGWVAVVRDPTRSTTARRLAFLSFADRFVRPGVHLAQVVQTYGISDWLDEEHLLDVTHGSQTAFDLSFRMQGVECGIYILAAPDALQAARNDAYVSFVLSRHLSAGELLAVLNKPYDPDVLPREGDPYVAAVAVSHPEEGGPAGR